METLKNTSRASKTAAKLLLSVSTFSAMILLSFLVPSAANSLYDIYVSAFWRESISSSLEKNCVFLLCNGLLVVIFTSSGLIYAPVNDDSKTEKSFLVGAGREEELSVVGFEEQEKSGKGVIVIEDYETEEEEEEEEEEEAIVELNKKCEDFIRRVKEEIKLGRV